MHVDEGETRAEKQDELLLVGFEIYDDPVTVAKPQHIQQAELSNCVAELDLNPVVHGAQHLSFPSKVTFVPPATMP